MEERDSILHELYVYSEWKPEPEYLQKPDNILPENLSALWRWLKYFGPKKSLIDSITVHKERQQKWHIALGEEGKVIAVLTDNILEIRTKRSEYATIAARTTVPRDAYAQWRKVVWSPDCSFVAVAFGNGTVSFYDLTASSLFTIPADCTRPGGLECTDNTHAVVDIIFLPLRVKDNKWNWEVLIVTFDGKLRGYLVSQTDGCKLHHTFRFAGGVGALAYSAAHSLLYVAGLPMGKDPSSPIHAGITAWRLLSDEPFYKLSVVSDQLETQLASERLQLYVPFLAGKNMAFIIGMVISPDGSKLACVHHTGDITVWRLPLLKSLHRWPLDAQPQHDVTSPLGNHVRPRDQAVYCPADLNWWSDEELTISRFTGSVTVCDIETMRNRLGGADATAQGAWLRGAPRLTPAVRGAFLALECEQHSPPPHRSEGDSMEVSTQEPDAEGSVYELARSLVKSALYFITDMEAFQPRPRRVAVVSRVYRLLCVRSTTPPDLFARKIESGNYADAITLAHTFNLDCDLVYQQQWRKTQVSTDAIQKYLSKVSKKIWAVHQCVDRLPETLPAAKELLQFGLTLTNDEILKEINKDRTDAELITDPETITLEDLNSYSSELLRCRHLMLFYKERLKLYEAILRSEKSTYVKDEYDRLRSNSLVHSATELAKEGRISALTCLWSHMKSVSLKLDVLEKLPETINPLEYKHLLLSLSEEEVSSPAPADLHERDWCRNPIFKTIWNTDWSEDATPDSENAAQLTVSDEEFAQWFEKRARQIESLSGLVSHALTLAHLAPPPLQQAGGLARTMFHLRTLDTLLYDVGLEDVGLRQCEGLSALDTCRLLMDATTPATFVADLKHYLIPFLKRHENLSGRSDTCVEGLTDYLESLSVDDLSWILLVLQSPTEFELDVRTHLDLVERCLFAHTTTDQLDKACDLLDTVMKESDGSIAPTELVRRLRELERLLAACGVAWWRGVELPLAALHSQRQQPLAARRTLAGMARRRSAGASIPVAKSKKSKWIARYKKIGREDKPSQQEWEKLLKDILELQTNLFSCVNKEECYEIYASALLTSGDAASIRLAADVLTVDAGQRRAPHHVPPRPSRALVFEAAREYFNSANSLTDPALDLAKCCLKLIKDSDPQLEEELDLIAALQILHAFEVNLLPVQVRLCDDKMKLIEDCLGRNPTAYLASHKLLKLAKLLRIAGDDEQEREGQVLQLVGTKAAKAGPGGGAAAAAAARRLAALRYSPAASLLADIATHAEAHADRDTRRELFAAAAAHCTPEHMERVLRARMALDLEGLQQMGAALRHAHATARQPDHDDDFSDAITTPVIEKKDLVAPSQADKKKPLFNYLLDTLQNKFASNDAKSSTAEAVEKTVHVPEFYRTLYPMHHISSQYYAYDRFSVPDEDARCMGQAMIKWYFIQNCLETGVGCHPELECEVIQKFAEEVMYTDTPLAVSCLLRSSGLCRPAGMEGAAVSAALYATLVKCNAPELRDDVYLTKPVQMARTTIQQSNASTSQLELIRACLDRLACAAETGRLRALACSVDGALFAADTDYRRETILRLARSTNAEQVEYASHLARKYNLEALELWVSQAAAVVGDSSAARLLAPPRDPRAGLARLTAEVWKDLRGDDHNTLINYFTIVKNVDDRAHINGLTAAEHIKLLKKAKAASHELNYKLLLKQPTAAQFSEHFLQILRPENVGMVMKFLRTLPASLRPPISVNALYTLWLTDYFFSVSPASATNKKWMQQYRQCASYFNKLCKDELRQFVRNTCFSDDAVQRVPSGTRNLMIMQAVDYCQQEQENEIKGVRNEATWAQVGQELTRWARFLENYHSSSVQAIVAQHQPRDAVWTEIEKSHGDREKLLSPLGKLLLSPSTRDTALTSLLQCLHIDTDTLAAACERCLDSELDVQTLVSRITHFHKQGIKFPEPLLERVMQRASDLGLPPHKQIALLSLSDKEQIRDDGDLLRVAQFTLETLRAEWTDCEIAAELTEEMLMNEETRRATLAQFLEQAGTWQKKKTLVDILNCWPPTVRSGDTLSLHCQYIYLLLKAEDQKESLVLIKLLLRKPILDEEEMQWLSDQIQGDAVINLVWIILLSKCEHSKNTIPQLLLKHKDALKDVEIEDDLTQTLLESGLFTKLVPTPLYQGIVNYILSTEPSSGEPEISYSVQWACSELLKANFIAEAGHLGLLSTGVPAALRGFSQSVLYSKKFLGIK